MFGTLMVQNQQNNPYLDPIIPFQTDISQYCCQYRYSDISIFIFGAFQNQYCNFFARPIQYIGLLHSTTLILMQQEEYQNFWQA